MNLLQPNERRSREPGDSEQTVAARVRLAEAGVDAELVRCLCRAVAQARLGPGDALLEVGCGIGTQLAALGEAAEAVCFGLDLSRHALRHAARRARSASCVLANADRALPFLDRSLALVLSVKSRCPAAELARVLRPGGSLLVAVPAPDDLLELRQATAGAGLARDPAERVLATLEPDFELLRRENVREQVTLEGLALEDLARSGYRGVRSGEHERLLGLGRLTVTLSTRVLVLARRAGGA